MTPAPIHLAGERLLLDPQGAAFWPGQGLLAVADLHFEKGSAAAARGQLVPQWDTRLTLDGLAALLRRWKPARLVALGDSFHDACGAGRLAPADRARLLAMIAAIDVTWVLGNHDPEPPEGLGGTAMAELRLGPLVFRHEARARSDGGAELCGHHHPKASVPIRGTTVTRPCFVADAARLMLPALGAYTGGLDVRDPAIARLFPRGGRVFLLGRDRLFSFPLAGRRVAAP
ncbi:MAG: ligase-associated DNA damage response endonuclease PdeM [Rhodospirillales bacterium]|nr:ligase-associated DNA damage response endonuclease PdeM [Rhodospirillales bacterium]MDE2198337.1 ligase-associated DNA damage response endonuclease PdeM [Rhodospirillales bacterium]MDE2576373.1 ligase-associated DNA damage response endonuclease PdeM [Rhodospirillales bacterium]